MPPTPVRPASGAQPLMSQPVGSLDKSQVDDHKFWTFPEEEVDVLDNFDFDKFLNEEDDGGFMFDPNRSDNLQPAIDRSGNSDPQSSIHDGDRNESYSQASEMRTGSANAGGPQTDTTRAQIEAAQKALNAREPLNAGDIHGRDDFLVEHFQAIRRASDASEQ